MTVCSTCNDTHRMELGDREVMCTRCPKPCEQCRQRTPGYGPGAYCGETPCPCWCHRKSESDGQRYLRLRWENDAGFRMWIATLIGNLAAAGALQLVFIVSAGNHSFVGHPDFPWWPGCGREIPKPTRPT